MIALTLWGLVPELSRLKLCSIFYRPRLLPWPNVSWRRCPTRWWSTTVTRPSAPCRLSHHVTLPPPLPTPLQNHCQQWGPRPDHISVRQREREGVDRCSGPRTMVINISVVIIPFSFVQCSHTDWKLKPLDCFLSPFGSCPSAWLCIHLPVQHDAGGCMQVNPSQS